MIQVFRRVFIVLLAVSVLGCSVAPTVPMSAEAKQAIKRIAVVHHPEPAYRMDPGMAPGGAALYIFGALGGLVLGAIEQSRYNAATSRFTEAVTPLRPEVSLALTDALERGLRAKGYEVTRIEPLARSADDKTYDFSKVDPAFDVVLVPALDVGYGVESKGVGPRVVATVSLFSRAANIKIFGESYVYNTRKFSRGVQIVPDARFVLPSIDAMYAEIGVAAEGLTTGAVKVAERMLADL